MPFDPARAAFQLGDDTLVWRNGNGRLTITGWGHHGLRVRACRPVAAGGALDRVTSPAPAEAIPVFVRNGRALPLFSRV